MRPSALAGGQCPSRAGLLVTQVQVVEWTVEETVEILQLQFVDEVENVRVETQVQTPMKTVEEPQLRFNDEVDEFLVVTRSHEAPQFPPW